MQSNVNWLKSSAPLLERASGKKQKTQNKSNDSSREWEQNTHTCTKQNKKATRIEIIQTTDYRVHWSFYLFYFICELLLFFSLSLCVFRFSLCSMLSKEKSCSTRLTHSWSTSKIPTRVQAQLIGTKSVYVCICMQLMPGHARDSKATFFSAIS